MAALAALVAVELALAGVTLWRGRHRTPTYTSVAAVEAALRDAGLDCRDTGHLHVRSLGFELERGSCQLRVTAAYSISVRIYIIDPADGPRAARQTNSLGFDWWVEGTIAVGPLGPGWNPVLRALGN